mgnify:CR=1 FL=1
MVHPYLKNRALPPDQIKYPKEALKAALERTLERRPELVDVAVLDDADRRTLDVLRRERQGTLRAERTDEER